MDNSQEITANAVVWDQLRIPESIDQARGLCVLSRQPTVNINHQTLLLKSAIVSLDWSLTRFIMLYCAQKPNARAESPLALQLVVDGWAPFEKHSADAQNIPLVGKQQSNKSALTVPWQTMDRSLRQPNSVLGKLVNIQQISWNQKMSEEQIVEMRDKVEQLCEDAELWFENLTALEAEF